MLFDSPKNSKPMRNYFRDGEEEGSTPKTKGINGQVRKEVKHEKQ